MQKWEYFIVDCKQDLNGKWRPWRGHGREIKNWIELTMTVFVDQLGDQGWELVSLSHLIDREFWVFKRSKL